MMQKLKTWATDPEHKEDRHQFKLRAKRFGSKWATSLFRFVFLMCMAYVILYPILILMSRSFRPAEDMFNPNIVWLPLSYTLENFTEAINMMKFWPTLWKTLEIVTISTLLTIAAAAVTGYGLARYRLKLGKLYMVLVVLTIIVPYIVLLLPTMEVMKSISFLGLGDTLGRLYTGEAIGLRIYNTSWVFYMPAMLGVGLRGGLFILVFYQFFRGMPKELENAARIDGCGEMKTFLRVMLPNAGAPMLVTAILSFVWYWTDYYVGQYMFTDVVMLSNKVAMIRQSINTSIGSGNRNTSEAGSVIAFSACLLFIVPPLLLYLVAQRFFMRSVERSGIVG